MKFEITHKQYKLYDNWKKNQKEKNPNIATAGGRWTFTFTPSGIGMTIKVTDNELNETLDLTDYDNF